MRRRRAKQPLLYNWACRKTPRDSLGATYEITIEKPPGICKGEVALTLDSRRLEDNLIPPRADGKVHEVRATVSRA